MLQQLGNNMLISCTLFYYSIATQKLKYLKAIYFLLNLKYNILSFNLF